ncbi:hypothetical protein RF11_14273 [Thelohanellus kitauei]|uniref:Uncharacterized protein n=1 Tax=Thelohanellus kitauei TaxID=669202 RepID=A0A0C2IJS9_THEKT|nr:hypothetical protein RF11_14273 [Thelohanellus kitauei]
MNRTSSSFCLSPISFQAVFTCLPEDFKPADETAKTQMERRYSEIVTGIDIFSKREENVLSYLDQEVFSLFSTLMSRKPLDTIFRHGLENSFSTLSERNALNIVEFIGPYCYDRIILDSLAQISKLIDSTL